MDFGRKESVICHFQVDRGRFKTGFFPYLSEQMDNFDIGCYTGYIISIIPN